MAVAVSSPLKQWADSVLQLVGVPVTPTNEDTLYRWARSESGSNPLRWNNPLNTTQSWPGAVPVNAAGVKRFPDIDSGARATAATLTNGYYPDILAALQNSIPTRQWGSAARAQVSKWGTNLAFLGGAAGAAGAQTFSSLTTGSTSVAPASGNAPSSQGGGFDPFGWLGNAISGAGVNIGSSITGAEQSFAKRAFAIFEIAAGGAMLLLGAVILVVLVVKTKPGQAAIEAAKTPVRIAGRAVSVTPQGRVAGTAVAGAAAKKPATPSASGGYKPYTASDRRRAAAVTARLRRQGGVAPSPAPAGQEIRSGGRRIEVTNPESRARLRAAGVEAA